MKYERVEVEKAIRESYEYGNIIDTEDNKTWYEAVGKAFQNKESRTKVLVNDMTRQFGTDYYIRFKVADDLEDANMTLNMLTKVYSFLEEEDFNRSVDCFEEYSKDGCYVYVGIAFDRTEVVRSAELLKASLKSLIDSKQLVFDIDCSEDCSGDVIYTRVLLNDKEIFSGKRKWSTRLN